MCEVGMGKPWVQALIHMLKKHEDLYRSFSRGPQMNSEGITDLYRILSTREKKGILENCQTPDKSSLFPSLSASTL